MTCLFRTQSRVRCGTYSTLFKYHQTLSTISTGSNAKAALFSMSAVQCGSKSLANECAVLQARPGLLWPLLCTRTMHIDEVDQSSFPNRLKSRRAMAFSGAAASANMGFHTSPVLSFVLAFFNVRLGGWLLTHSSARIQRICWRLSQSTA